MERLRELDKVAYVRFASVYRKFEDVDEFLHELKNLIGRCDAKVTVRRTEARRHCEADPPPW